MDKKGVLINRLQEQYQQGADEISLLNTALLLVTELQHRQAAEPSVASGKVSVIMPVKLFEVVNNNPFFLKEKPEETSYISNHPEVGNTPVDETLNEVMKNNILPESDIEHEAGQLADPMILSEPGTEQPEEQISLPEPETEPIQPSAINMLAEEKYNDMIDEIPTLAQQQPKVVYELNQSLQSEEPSINDKLKQTQTEATSRVQTEPIKDLRKAIGINDKYVFIRELFRNDEAAYERSIKTINGFNMLPEAEYWIQREMKYKLGWDDNNPTVKAFYQLVRRRFS